MRATKARQQVLWVRALVNRQQSMRSVMKNGSKNRFVSSLRQAMAGVQKHFAQVPSLVLDGASTPPAALTATFQSAIDAVAKATAAEQAFHDSVAAQDAAMASAKTSLAALHSLVKSQLGSTETVLGDFGFTAPKRQMPSEATKAAAVVKRAATRAARGTKGKRQKAAIKGQVPATTAAAPALTGGTTNKQS
jgi:hypothetical protein